MRRRCLVLLWPCLALTTLFAISVVNTQAMADAFIVPESDSWEAETHPLVSSMGRLTCAAGYHGVATATCDESGGQFVFSGCVENVCTAESGNPEASWVVVPSDVADQTTVSGLTGLTCETGFTGTAAVACVDHGGVFQYSGCSEMTCTPTSATFDDSHVDAEDESATTVSGLGALSCAVGYHPECTGTLAEAVDDGTGTGGTTDDCAILLTNTYSCPDECTTGPTAACLSSGSFRLEGCLPNRCAAPGGPTNGGVETDGVRVTNSAEVVVGEEVATSLTPDGVSGIDGLGLGAACTSPESDPSLECANNAGWMAAGTEASCPTGCDFHPACLGGGWNGDFRSEGWSGGDGLGVTTATCLENGGVFTFSGCSDVDDCTTENDNGDCGDDANCVNTPGSR